MTANLPEKVRLPFVKLIEAEQLDGPTMEAIELAFRLDPALRRTPTKVFGFAIGLLYMRMKGHSILDTLRMAEQLGRRVNVAWSARRWKDEHDRLSRAITLRQLAGESIEYDLSRYQALLPASFPGYLIGSSRRLGMEGLRQRHCVASRHHAVQSGYYALASLLFDRQRWTVTLNMTGGDEPRLRLSEMRGRFNAVPTAQCYAKARELLGIQETKAEAASATTPTDEPRYLETLREVLPVLRTHGVASVQVDFDGSGDSGSIDSVSFFDAEQNGCREPEETVVLNRTVRDFVDGHWAARTEVGRVSLGDAITEATDQYLSTTPVDWYNNEGGYGALVIDVAAGSVNLEINTRFTESSCEYDRTTDIVSGEEVETNDD